LVQGDERRTPAIWLTQIGGRFHYGKEFLIAAAQQFPIELKPGAVFDDFSADATQVRLVDITFLGAWDTLGKIHKVSGRQLRSLRKELS
jgi:hypothetical protein